MMYYLALLPLVICLFSEKFRKTVDTILYWLGTFFIMSLFAWGLTNILGGL